MLEGCIGFQSIAGFERYFLTADQALFHGKGRQCGDVVQIKLFHQVGAMFFYGF